MFELVRGSSGAWTEQILYAFGSASGDGQGPFGGMVSDGNGHLYGATSTGGLGNFGTVYELAQGSSGGWTEQILYQFTGGIDGGWPFGGVVRDSSGNIYGTAEIGGTFGFGLVYEIVKGSDGTWTEKDLHSFTGGNDGAYPNQSTLTFDGAGNIYGMTPLYGAHDYGVIFELIPGSNGSWKDKVVYAFKGAASGSSPTWFPMWQATFTASPRIPYLSSRRPPTESGHRKYSTTSEEVPTAHILKRRSSSTSRAISTAPHIPVGLATARCSNSRRTRTESGARKFSIASHRRAEMRPIRALAGWCWMEAGIFTEQLPQAGPRIKAQSSKLSRSPILRSHLLERRIGPL